MKSESKKRKLVKKFRKNARVSFYAVNECTNASGANCGNCVSGCS
jgi:hypothetical protein